MLTGLIQSVTFLRFLYGSALAERGFSDFKRGFANSALEPLQYLTKNGVVAQQVFTDKMGLTRQAL